MNKLQRILTYLWNGLFMNSIDIKKNQDERFEKTQKEKAERKKKN